ncbi:Transglycosylase SLT domain-containing protein [Micromonospora matsumotoense]|uniref:Transglycosylase SLT domain-containing protein n=1 Tax=Micromonospora matsumotoense TaxID=121616 RepID=A0A1C5AMI8_9ACTN|nr:SH3 domain-containing protein [Micromonospora matsumotoense]SCF46452.1 Transglycosylase SLT domain-containing protein [Micromonospora matsumotoense]
MRLPLPLPALRHGRRVRLALGLALVAVVGVSTVPTPATAAPATAGPAAHAASAPRPTDQATAASVGGPATGAKASRVGVNAVGIDLCAQVAYAAGFRNNPLVTAVAVAMAESSCNPSAVGSNGPTAGCPNGSLDRGLWQINNCYHPTVNDTCAYTAQCNANAAYNISSGGSNWQPWSTYNNGAYAGYLSAAQAAVARLGGGDPPVGVTGTILANPSLNIRTGPGTTYGIAGSVNYGATVKIACYTFGEYVSGGYWPSSTWDRITNTATGVTGYVADTWVNTTYDVKTMVGRC